MSERKFIQGTWIKCESKEHQKVLWEKLRGMGYFAEHFADSDFGLYPIMCTNFNFTHNRVEATKGEWFDFPTETIQATSDELFLALAAMSEGDEFFPGEWGVHKGFGLVKFIHKYKNGRIDVESREKGAGSVSLQNLRKATAAEIVEHFEKKAKSDLAMRSGPKGPVDYTEDHIGPKIPVEDRPAESESTDKSFFDQLAEATKPDSATQIKVDKSQPVDLGNYGNKLEFFLDVANGRRPYRHVELVRTNPQGPMHAHIIADVEDYLKGKFGDDFMGIKDVFSPGPDQPGPKGEKGEPGKPLTGDALKEAADAFADSAKLSKALDEWMPEPFEPVWVWMDGEEKRTRMLFAFLSEKTVFVFEEQFATWSNFEVHEYQNFAKIDAPISVPMKDVKYLLALRKGVPESLIKIEGEQ